MKRYGQPRIPKKKKKRYVNICRRWLKQHHTFLSLFFIIKKASSLKSKMWITEIAIDIVASLLVHWLLYKSCMDRSETGSCVQVQGRFCPLTRSTTWALQKKKEKEAHFRGETLISDQRRRANLSWPVCTWWVRPRPWCHTLSQRRTDGGDKQK